LTVSLRPNGCKETDVHQPFIRSGGRDAPDGHDAPLVAVTGPAGFVPQKETSAKLAAARLIVRIPFS